MSDDPTSTRFVELEADPIAHLVAINGVMYLVIDLQAGCECHPEETVFIQRRHCLS